MSDLLIMSPADAGLWCLQKVCQKCGSQNQVKWSVWALVVSLLISYLIMQFKYQRLKRKLEVKQ